MTVVELQQIATVHGGGRLKLSGDHFVARGIPAYGAGGLNGYLDRAEYDDREGVILSSIGARCGKCFHVRGAWTSLANTQVILPDSSRVDTRFLWYQLNDEGRWPRAGSAQPFIKPSDVKVHRVWLPPLTEQRRIASVLDQVSLLRAKRQQAITALDDLTRSTFIKMFGYPMDGSGGWPLVKLGDLAHIIRGASPRPAGDPRYFGGNVPWLKIGDITAAPGREVEKIKEGVTEAGQKKSVLLPPKTLVLTNSATVGVPKVVVPATCIHDGFLAFLDLDTTVEQAWLYAALKVSRAQLVALAPEGTQKNLNGPIVKAIRISLPPLHLQRQFVAILASVEGVTSTIASSAGELESLFATLKPAAWTSRQ